MITSVEIENLRGIQSGKLENLTPLTVLVGPNGCGKSTLLDALLMGAHPNLAEAMALLLKRRRETTEPLRWLFYKSDRSQTLQVNVNTIDPRDWRAVRLLKDPSSHAVACFVQHFDEHGSAAQIQVVAVAASGKIEYIRPTPQLDGVDALSVVDADTANDAVPLHALYTSAVSQGRHKDVEAMAAEVLPGLDSILLGTEGDRPVVFTTFADFGVPLAVSGDGIQALVRLCLELASKSGGIVLLEEPEIHGHPGALHQSARAIWAAVRRDIQVVVSTHSLDLIDSLLSEVADGAELAKMTVFRLRLAEGCLLSSRRVGEDIAFARTEIGDDLR